jgi:hypothetical protein
MATLATLVFLFAHAGTHSATSYAGQTQLKACKIQPRQLILRKTTRPTRLTGTVLKGASVEYQLKAATAITVDLESTSTDKFKFDLYLLNPPKALAKQKDSWSGQLSKDTPYVLAVNNCAGRSTATYQLTITTR